MGCPWLGALPHPQREVHLPGLPVRALCRRCRFAASEVAAVSCDWSRCSTNGQPHEEIVIKLKDGSTRKFGALMKEDSREYIFHYLKRKFGC